jgi:hypothetical protein
MKKLLTLSARVSVAGLLGCQATLYQRLGTTLAGGYSEKVMSQDSFCIKFAANDNTSPREFDKEWRGCAIVIDKDPAEDE